MNGCNPEADDILEGKYRSRMKQAKWVGAIPLPSLVVGLAWGYCVNWDAQGAVIALPFFVAFLVGSGFAIILGLSCIFSRANAEGKGLDLVYVSVALNSILFLGYVVIVLLRLPILPPQIEKLLKPRERPASVLRTTNANIVDGYDAVSNRTSRNRDGGLTTWTYDDKYRLLTQQRSGFYATMTYDSTDNILTKHNQGSDPMTFTVDASNRIVTMVQGDANYAFTYDNNGNLTAEAGTVGGDPSSSKVYVYDQENRMILDRDVIGVGFAKYTMTYDGDGLRRSLHIGSTKTTFIWDGTDYLQGRSS